MPSHTTHTNNIQLSNLVPIDCVSSIPNGKLHWHQGKRSPIVREVYEELGIEIIDRPRYCEVDRKKAEVQASTESKKRVN